MGSLALEGSSAAVMKRLDYLSVRQEHLYEVVTIDGGYEYSVEDLQNWDLGGPGTSSKILFQVPTTSPSLKVRRVPQTT